MGVDCKSGIRISDVVCGMSYRVLSIAGSVQRIAYGGIRLRRGKLGLIGFVFSSGAERDIVVNLCGEGDCVGFGVLGIGFVLRKKFDS